MTSAHDTWHSCRTSLENSHAGKAARQAARRPVKQPSSPEALANCCASASALAASSEHDRYSTTPAQNERPSGIAHSVGHCSPARASEATAAKTAACRSQRARGIVARSSGLLGRNLRSTPQLEGATRVLRREQASLGCCPWPRGVRAVRVGALFGKRVLQSAPEKFATHCRMARGGTQHARSRPRASPPTSLPRLTSER